MSESYDLPEVERFTTGTEGEPGHRVFYLQAHHPGGVVSFRCEKAQVAALCRYFEEMLADLPNADPAGIDLSLVEPVIPEWVVGSLGVSYEADDDRFVLVADELVEEGETGARARLVLTRAQVAAFVRHGTEIVAAGRPPCPLCGAPMDPEGHMCIRLNGHRDLVT